MSRADELVGAVRKAKKRLETEREAWVIHDRSFKAQMQAFNERVQAFELEVSEAQEALMGYALGERFDPAMRKMVRVEP